MVNLQNKKNEIIQQIGAEGLKKLKFTKLLKLITFEIEELIEYWTIRQVHQMVNEVFNINISAPLFYRFCEKNIKKDEKSELGVSNNNDDRKVSSLEDLIGK